MCCRYLGISSPQAKIIINSGCFVLFELDDKLQYQKGWDKRSPVSGMFFITVEESWYMKGFRVMNVSVAIEVDLYIHRSVFSHCDFFFFSSLNNAILGNNYFF